MSLQKRILGQRRLMRHLRKLKTEMLATDVVRVTRAERWLRLGKPERALTTLQHLKKGAWNHPWTEQVFWRVAQVVDSGA